MERNGDTLIGWPDYQRGQVAIVFSTCSLHRRRAQRRELGQALLFEPDEAHSSVCRPAGSSIIELTDIASQSISA